MSTETHEKTTALGLTLPQLLAGAAAAAFSAYAATWLGVAGTVLGAGLAYLVTTVAAATFSASLAQLRSRRTLGLSLALFTLLGVAYAGLQLARPAPGTSWSGLLAQGEQAITALVGG